MSHKNKSFQIIIKYETFAITENLICWLVTTYMTIWAYVFADIKVLISGLGNIFLYSNNIFFVTRESTNFINYVFHYERQLRKEKPIKFFSEVNQKELH